MTQPSALARLSSKHDSRAEPVEVGAGATFLQRVERHRLLLRKRGHALEFEHMPAAGQAASWYGDVIRCVSRSGRDVAKQLARLCGNDSKVTLPWRSLADAVGVQDALGRTRAYSERGVAVLVESEWLAVETVGERRGAKTTFYLLPGEAVDYLPWWAYGDEDDVEFWAA